MVRARRNARDYWARSLANAPDAVDLPTQRPRPAQRSYRASTLETTVDATLLARIKETSAASNATVFHFLLAASMVWLHRITGQRRIVIGVPVAGQMATDLQQMAGCERLLGHLTSLLPVGAAIDETRPFTDLVADVKRDLLEARAHDACTYGELIREYDPPHAPGALPLVSVLLNLNDQPPMHWAGLRAEIRVPPRSHIFFDLEINVWQRDDGFGVACYFAKDIFDEVTVRKWLDQWQALLADAALHPTRELACLGEGAQSRVRESVARRVGS
jgi:non-ribosomal peptide synthetase component F